MHSTRPLCPASHAIIRTDDGTAYADVAADPATDVVLSTSDRDGGLVMLYLDADEATALAEQLLCSVRAAALRDALAAALDAVAPPF